jgi:hypothetical protein
MAHSLDARRCLRGDDPAVAVGDHHGRLVARGQGVPDRGDVAFGRAAAGARLHPQPAALRAGESDPPGGAGGSLAGRAAALHVVAPSDVDDEFPDGRGHERGDDRLDDA